MPEGDRGPAVVEVDDGRIAVIATDGLAPDRTLAPGFIDLQVNGVGAMDVGPRRRVGRTRRRSPRPRRHHLVPDARHRASRLVRRAAGSHRRGARHARGDEGGPADDRRRASRRAVPRRRTRRASGRLDPCGRPSSGWPACLPSCLVNPGARGSAARRHLAAEPRRAGRPGSLDRHLRGGGRRVRRGRPAGDPLLQRDDRCTIASRV